jgi:hypothetical protein
MKNEGGREAGKCSKVVPDRGDRCLFTFLWSRRLFFNVFPFPVCNAKLIGEADRTVRSASFYSWHENVPKLPLVASPCLLRILTFLYIFCIQCANILAHRCTPPPIGNADQEQCANNFFFVFGSPLLLTQGVSVRQ